MKVRVEYQEFWDVVITDNPARGTEIDLPEPIILQCRAAQKAWEESCALLRAALENLDQ